MPYSKNRSKTLFFIWSWIIQNLFMQSCFLIARGCVHSPERDRRGRKYPTVESDHTTIPSPLALHPICILGTHTHTLGVFSSCRDQDSQLHEQPHGIQLPLSTRLWGQPSGSLLIPYLAIYKIFLFIISI